MSYKQSAGKEVSLHPSRHFFNISAGKDGVKPPFRHSVCMTSVLFLFNQSCRHPHHNSAIRTAAAISYKCFAKPTIILSYPFVYWFKPICYGMIVAILNYHSSVITIMVKNDNFLCVNCTIKTGTVREQVRNLLKRLLFSSRQAFLLSKTACKAA